MKSPRSAWRAFADFTAFVVFEAHVEPVEWYTAVNAFLWGAWLANPWMDVFGHGYYMGMQRVPESVWGGVAMIAAAVQILGRLTGCPRVIRVGAIALVGLWLFGAGALAIQNWRFASLVTYPMMALASVLVAYRAAPRPPRPYREMRYARDS